MIKRLWTWFRCIKIVKFSDDTYGIRKGWFFYRYWRGCRHDLENLDWIQGRKIYDSFEEVSRFYGARFHDLGTIVYYERTEMTPEEQEEEDRIKELEDALVAVKEERDEYRRWWLRLI